MAPAASASLEADDKARGDNAAFVGTPAMSVSPSTGKRQRRPSIRLEELGDQQIDRKVLCSPLTNVCSPALLKENFCQSNVGPESLKLAKSCHNTAEACVKHYGHLKGSSPGVEIASFYGNGLLEPNPVGKKVMNENQSMHLQKTPSKKGRGGRKPGVPKLITSMPQSGALIRGRGKRKVLCIPAARGVQSDKENNAHSSALFIASDNASDKSGGDGVMTLNSQHNHQERGYLEAQVQVRDGRTQASSRRQALEVMDDADGRIWAHTKGSARPPRGKLVIKRREQLHGMQSRLVLEVNGAGNSVEPTSQRLLATQANRSVAASRGKLVITGKGQLHGMQNRLVLEANGAGNRPEPTKGNLDHIVGRPHSFPLVGVREWLCDLDLGKYAELFEAHEVEPEVLPLLTLDDLKEIGVLAVGPRRKMFCGIQQIRKAVLSEANQVPVIEQLPLLAMFS